MTEPPVQPPWLRFPSLTPSCVGWNMGKGEEYLAQWHAVLESMTADQRADYERSFPAPRNWGDAYGRDRGSEGAWWRPGGAPRYSRSDLVRRGVDGREFVFFWQRSSKRVGPGVFSQWQPSRFHVDADEYTCAEQYMMARKAALFDDVAAQRAIMATTDAAEMKRLGRHTANFRQDVWDRHRHTVALEGNYAKFTQNPDLRDILLGTGDAIIAEASPLDTIWGIGVTEDDPVARHPRYWGGSNLLGFALMEVRDEIRRVWGLGG